MQPIRRIIAVPLLAAALGLTACGGQDSATSGSSSAAADRQAPAAGAAAPAPSGAAGIGSAGSAARAAGGSGGGAAQPAPEVRMVRTADLVVEVKELKTSAARVRSIAEGAGGSVSSETTSYGGDEPIRTASGTDKPTATVVPGESVLVLRVPVAVMAATTDHVASVGTELSRTSSAVDVTADLADIGSRIKTQQASVERVRALLGKATSLQDIVLLESELSRRESDLEALEARQASLAGRADLSTLTVTLRTPAAKPAPVTSDDNSFVSGLKRGWRAVVVSTGVVLTVLGALLPLAVVAAIVGWPVGQYLRRRRRRAAARGAAPAGVDPLGALVPAGTPTGAPSGPPSAPPTAAGRP